MGGNEVTTSNTSIQDQIRDLYSAFQLVIEGLPMASEANSLDGNVEETVESSNQPKKPPFIGRMLVGGPLAFSALMNLVQSSQKIKAGQEQGLPLPSVLVPGGSIMLLLSGIGISLWRKPVVAAASATTFLAIATPIYHGFWHESGEERIEERQSFENNLVMIGATLLLTYWGLWDRHCSD